MDWGNLFQDNRTELKRLLNSQYKGPWHSPAIEYLRRIQARSAAIEAERAAKRKRKLKSKHINL
jgi:hypothetical protein